MELGKARSTEEIIKDIKATLETKVKDNVAVHGGEINFLSYEKGIVRLQMAGACSIGQKCTYTQDGTKLSSWIWFTKEVPVDLSKDNCN